MKLKVYKIYHQPSKCEHCTAIAFTEQQAREYCKNKEAYINEGTWYYQEEDVDTKHALECSPWRYMY